MLEKLKPFIPFILQALLFFFFFQLITEFIEAIDLFGLLGTDIPPEIVLVLLFLAPFALLLFRNKISHRWINILGSVVIFSRTLEILLNTRGRMIVSGIGVAAWLLFFPALLSKTSVQGSKQKAARETSIGLSLAVFALILMRALHSGSDLSVFGMFKLGAWLLAILALYLLWTRKDLIDERDIDVSTHRPSVTVNALGLSSVLILLYFGFTTPHVLGRWVAAPPLAVFPVLLISWIIAGWVWLQLKSIHPNIIRFGSLLFVIALVLTILPHQPNFPASMDSGYPLSEPQISTFHLIPFYAMLILSPILLFSFNHYIRGILKEKPRLQTLAGSFGLGGLFILLMVFSQVFTTVYDYIPVVGPFFRDKFWFVFLIAGFGLSLPSWFTTPKDNTLPEVSHTSRSIWLTTAILFSVVSLGGLLFLGANPLSSLESGNSLKVFTYNIQQGYDEFGERNFDGQIDLIKSKNPDIIGLQESDPARIAGGNTDIVTYFADALDMYSYYGPSPIAGTFGVALLSKFPIENPQTFYLYSKGEQVAVVSADITVGEQTFKVFVTHLGNGGPIFQISQMLDLMRGEQNVIAIGDYNFRPYEKQYAITVAEYTDAYEVSGSQQIPSAFNLEERIDHAFVSNGISVDYVEYLIEPESDHPALYLEIGW